MGILIYLTSLYSFKILIIGERINAFVKERNLNEQEEENEFQVPENSSLQNPSSG